MYNTIEERKRRLTNELSILKFRYNTELSLKIEGRGTNLRIWTGNEKCVAEGGGKKLIYMRLDCHNNYSVPWSKENFKYLEKPSKEITKLLKFGFTSDISCLDEILEITKKMKYRELMSW